MAQELAVVLGAVAAVLLLAVLAVRVSVRLGFPSLVLYLAIGVLLGEAGIGVEFESASLTEALGLAALVLILTEGGLTTRWPEVRASFWPGAVLSTVAVVVSIAVTGTALHLIFGFEWRVALLWGAVLASTDAAAVFSVLRNISVGKRLVGALEIESGMNDAAAYLVVVLLASGSTATWVDPLIAGYQLVVGGLIGVGLGWLGGQALRRSALPATGLYPLATVAVPVLAFSAGSFVHASGLLAAYFAALVLGNSKLPHRNDTLSFAEGLGWLSQIGLFVLLGLFMSPSRLLDAVVPGLVAGLVLTFLARPISVAVSLTPFRVPWREQAFLSWAGLRGAVPIVLAMIPITEGRPGADKLVDAVFVLVIVLTIVQGSTLPLVARLLGLAKTGEPKQVDVDAAPLDELGAVLLTFTVPAGSKMHGVYLSELRLPVGATVSLLVRDGVGHTPGLSTRVQELDQLLVVATEGVRTATERRIRAVDRAGRFARWRGETGED
ncbi:potassium/proton antiporter [Actinophytocola glycyrrhizae]|uniref:Potassium/proton antiporter n=1 Tax=Actinophytocola glycyrrhizae TaxID=2044873 RepID=A0ABV9S917_9PSEU